MTSGADERGYSLFLTRVRTCVSTTSIFSNGDGCLFTFLMVNRSELVIRGIRFASDQNIIQFFQAQSISNFSLAVL